MTLKKQMLLVAVTLLVALPAPHWLAAQEHRSKPSHYTLTDLGVLGGPGTNSAAYGINREGWLSGSGNLTVGGPQHGFLWYGHAPLVDLGTLGGPACTGCNSEAGGPNAFGESAVFSETAKPAYEGEDFCGFGTHRQCLAAIWRYGKLTALPTLAGGQNSQAFDLNHQGQIVGFSENGTQDSTCASSIPSQVLRFEAVIWEPNGKIAELQPLKGDTVAFAFGVNNHGQVVGTSGLCSNTSLPPVNANGAHAVLWERDGSVVDLGTLGGPHNVADAINNRGQVVGTSLSPKDGNIHAFLWTREEGMQDLGTFPGAIATVPPCCKTINDRGEVVGFSIDSMFNFRAFLWRDKKLIDLNTLVPPDSPLYLQLALSINDAGEIVGQGITKSGELHAFLATPCEEGERRFE